MRYHPLSINVFLKVFYLTIILLSITILPDSLSAQDNQMTDAEYDTLIAVARKTMAFNKYCALITLDETGQPQARTMNPFPLEEDMVIWFATNRKSRKVKEIQKDSRVSIYYADHNNASGYVVITGSASIIDDKKVLEEMKREYWEKSIRNWREILVLIKITPEKIDILNYEHGLTGDSVTWRTPSFEMKSKDQ